MATDAPEIRWVSKNSLVWDGEPNELHQSLYGLTKYVLASRRLSPETVERLKWAVGMRGKKHIENAYGLHIHELLTDILAEVQDE